ncbi:hypothetical protein FB566_2161 [Stackebrandtia endophytica]|uniref:Uncharacterized protein n=1 Tax=Stackebrandtia endophytica TaxID=1496996 RepID=A0A543AVM0_9ACTN|nr:hypothetical protein [Stackebrandtia endophytica]TQL76628.1 hypothetical protein FB566_2161 [Stackebrandtia endophytica]
MRQEHDITGTGSVLDRPPRPQVVRCVRCGATDAMLIFDLGQPHRARCAATEPCLTGPETTVLTCPFWCVVDHSDETGQSGWNHFSDENTVVIRNGTDVHEVTMGIMAWQGVDGEFEPTEVYLASPAMEMYLSPAQAAAFAGQLGVLARLADPAPPADARMRPLARPA